jgi:hypothetical protein
VILRSEGGDLQDHVSLSYRQEPFSGTYWDKFNFLSTGVLVIDLGEHVEGIDTFSVFQLAVKDAKCSTIQMQRAPKTYADSGSPPQNKLEWGAGRAAGVFDGEGSALVHHVSCAGRGACSEHHRECERRWLTDILWLCRTAHCAWPHAVQRIRNFEHIAEAKVLVANRRR